MTDAIQSTIIILSIVFFFIFLLIIQFIFMIKSELKDLKRIIDKLDDKVRENEDKIRDQQYKINRLEK